MSTVGNRSAGDIELHRGSHEVTTTSFLEIHVISYGTFDALPDATADYNSTQEAVRAYALTNITLASRVVTSKGGFHVTLGEKVSAISRY